MSSFQPEIVMSSAVSKQISKSTRVFCELAIKDLSEHFGFDYDEAVTRLQLDRLSVTSSSGKMGKEKAEKGTPKIPLPFCGKVIDNCCEGIRTNHQLFTQCTNTKPKSGERFCKTCAKSITPETSGVPKLGTVQDRADPEKWKAIGGKRPLNYGNVMNKLNISREEATTEAARLGWEIPEDQFNFVVPKKGRPKKDTSADSTSDDEPPAAPKKRGRPKKEKKVKTTSGDDVIAQLVAAAKTGDAEPSSPTSTTSSDSEKKRGRPKIQRTPSQQEQHDADLKAKRAAARKAKAVAKKIEVSAPSAAAPVEPAKDEPSLELQMKDLQAQIDAKTAETSKESDERLKMASADAESKKIENDVKALGVSESKHDDDDDDDDDTPFVHPTPTTVAIDELEPESDEEDDDDDDDDDDDEDDERDEPPTRVARWEFKGVTYLKSSSNDVFDLESHDQIGTFNGSEIIPVEN